MTGGGRGVCNTGTTPSDANAAWGVGRGGRPRGGGRGRCFGGGRGMMGRGRGWNAAPPVPVQPADANASEVQSLVDEVAALRAELAALKGTRDTDSK
jgi:hypothetical protein